MTLPLHIVRDVVSRTWYEFVMDDDLEDYPWEGASNESREEADHVAKMVVDAIEAVQDDLPKERPPLPVEVRKILEGTFTPGGMDKWWTAYLHMDPMGQESHAAEWARRSVANIDLGLGFRQFR